MHICEEDAVNGHLCKSPSGSLNVGCVVEFSMLSVITHSNIWEKQWRIGWEIILLSVVGIPLETKWKEIVSIKSSKKNGFVCVWETFLFPQISMKINKPYYFLFPTHAWSCNFSIDGKHSSIVITISSYFQNHEQQSFPTILQWLIMFSQVRGLVVSAI